MKFRYLFIILLFSTLPLITSCEDNVLVLNTLYNRVHIASEGGIIKSKVESSLQWKVSVNKDWLSVVKIDSSHVAISVKQNTSYNMRSAMVDISSPSMKESIEVIQNGKGYSILRIHHNQDYFRGPIVECNWEDDNTTAYIEWGDNSVDYYSGNLEHSYLTNGEKEIQVIAVRPISFELESIKGVSMIDFSNF